MGGRKAISIGLGLLAAMTGIAAPASAMDEDAAAVARAGLDRWMDGRKLDVQIETQPKPCDAKFDFCYSHLIPRLRWAQDDKPRHACRTAMLPLKAAARRIDDEGDFATSPYGIFSSIVTPHDVWIDWRAVTEVAADGKTVHAYAPLNSYRVSFTFKKPTDATSAARLMETMRVACADPDAPVGDILQAYRVAMKGLYDHARALRTTLRVGWLDISMAKVGYLKNNMCAGSYIGGMRWGVQPFDMPWPEMRNEVRISQSGVIIKLEQPKSSHVLEILMDDPDSAAKTINALQYIGNWCRTEYDDTKIYRHIF